MTVRSRILLAIAALALGVMYVAPLWKITLDAPQYPEGLGMYIEIDNIRGVQPNDLKNINGLNHYIGMKTIVPDSIPELRWMPWIVGVLIITGLSAAAAGWRPGLYAWTVLFAVIALAGLVDFYLWEYDYGHNLDIENAAIKIPGMNYQPPLIGQKQLLNFTASSWPAPGGWAAFGALATAVAVSISEWRRSAIHLAVLVALLVGSAGCTPGPQPIHYGVDACEYCRMAIADPRFAVELVNEKGKVYKFDSIECAASYQDSAAGRLQAWVHPPDDADVWIRAEDVRFVRDPDIRSPMGAGLAVLSRADGSATGAAADDDTGLTVLSWEEIVSDAARTTSSAGNQNSTLTDRVAAAAPGDTIFVDPGEYREAAAIVVDKPLAIVGRPGAVLYGSDRQGIFLVTADSVTIRGLELRGVGASFVEDRAAVAVESADFCRIEGNTFVDNFFAVYLAESRGCAIIDNRISSSFDSETHSGNGIHLWYSRDVVVSGNRISGHRDGIYFEFVEDGVVEDNVSYDNHRYGLHFMFSDRCRYERNTFQRNGAGVAVMYSEHVAISGNRFVDNKGPAAYGLLLKEIDDAVIGSNAFVSNSTGMHMEGSNRVRVADNEFVDNGWALRLMANSEQSVFRGNRFVRNTFDVATNSRRTASTFSGNYWDNYRGYDLDRDGVGDVPFRPVRLFSLTAERNRPVVILQGSLFVGLLDMVERAMPTITPTNLEDATPSMRPRTASPREGESSTFEIDARQ